MSNNNKHHHISAWAPYFKDLKSGIKLFELRKNDRDYRVGDTLVITEQKELDQDNSDIQLIFIVTYIFYGTPGNLFGLPEGYCIMSLKPVVKNEVIIENKMICPNKDCAVKMIIRTLEDIPDCYYCEECYKDTLFLTERLIKQTEVHAFVKHLEDLGVDIKAKTPMTCFQKRELRKRMTA